MGQENNSQDLTHQHSHSTSELKAITRKREALEQVVRITLAINRLQQAFNAILNMGKAASKIPESALRIYSKLSNDVKHYSTQKLSESLERIERHVKEDLQTVLSFTQIAEEENQDTLADNLNDIDEDFLFKTINDFKAAVKADFKSAMMKTKSAMWEAAVTMGKMRAAVRFTGER